MRTVDQMVEQEVLLCASTLVYDITQGLRCSEEDDELWTPVISDDAYIECAEDDGAIFEQLPDKNWTAQHEDQRGEGRGPFKTKTQAAIDYCSEQLLAPQEYAGDVFEHWAVTGWFADKLEAAGERVVRDWHGLTIWARTNTGQQISVDYVIKKIYEETHK